jgi:DNA sulfur modification protein DndD
MLNKSYSDREHEVKIDLNESINSIFSEMYHGHRKVIINDNYQIKLLTTIGASQEEIADTGGLRAIKNFAYITGLVDIARKRIARKKSSDEENFHETEPYPLIMDAPFSATDEKHIENISKIIPSIAEQVIIIVMQKDWAYAKAIIKDKIGKSYTIENIENSETRSKIREGE